MSVLLRGRGLARTYTARRTWVWQPRTLTSALDGVDIDVRAGSAVGIVAESGSASRRSCASCSGWMPRPPAPWNSTGARSTDAPVPASCTGCAGARASCSRIRTRRSIRVSR